MLHYLSLFKLKPEADEERIEWMMRETRMRLLKIPEILAVRCGKRISDKQVWPFFIAFDVESSEKLALCIDDSHFVKFREEVLTPHISEQLALQHEMEPGRDTRYS